MITTATGLRSRPLDNWGALQIFASCNSDIREGLALRAMFLDGERAKAPRGWARAQTGAELIAHLAERLWWQVARRDAARVARRWSRQPVVAGVYPLDDGAWLDDFCDVVQALGVGHWLAEVQGTAVQRAMVPVVQDGPALSPADRVRARAPAGPARLAVPR